MLDVDMEGDEVWAATSHGIELHDRTGRVLAAVGVPKTTRAVRAVPGIAYAGSGSSIYVIRRNGDRLEIVRAVDTGGTINDLALAGNQLFAATTAGLVQFSLADVLNPARVATIPTSSPNVIALATDGNALYAADDDTSLERFSTGTAGAVVDLGAIVTPLAHPTAVAASGGRVYVSDTQNTTVIADSTIIGTPRIGAYSLAPFAANVVFVGGSDRRFRAVDFTNPVQPVELFEDELIPNGGTINRAETIFSHENQLFVAAGDAGLLTYDVTGFATPYPVRGYGVGLSSTVVASSSVAIVGRDTGGIVEYTVAPSGALTLRREWAAGAVHTLHDVTENNFLISSQGTALTHWTLASTTPVAVTTATFRANVIDAVQAGNTLYALLEDGSVWSASTATTPATPVQLDVGTANVALGRFDDDVAIAEGLTDGRTAIRYYTDANFNTTPAPVFVQGVATGGIAVGDRRAAVFTFTGLNVADFTTGSAALVPGSNGSIARGMAFSGTALLVATDDALVVWNSVTRERVRSFALPADANAVAAAGVHKVAAVATFDGIASVAFESSTRLPSLASKSSTNYYYRQLASTSERAYLLDSRGVDIFSTAFTGSLEYVSSIRAAGLVDVAATEELTYTVSANGTVRRYYRDGGSVLAEGNVRETNDTQPLALAVVGGAPWVTISRGCSAGACVQKTLVLDPLTLAVTQTMDGGATDVVTSGTRAYAVFTMPAEVRVLSLADATHPQQLASKPTTAKSAVGFASGIVYALGETLDAYGENDLGVVFEGRAIGGRTMVVSGGCAVVDSRVYALPAWTLAATLAVPSEVEQLAVQPTRLLMLTEHSLEIFISAPQRQRTRRRP